MKLIEHEQYYEYPMESFFISGFTKPEMRGGLPDDIKVLFPGREVAYMNQEHGDKILSIEKEDVYDCDGIITATPDLIIAVKTADCLPLVLFSKEQKKIGVIHMGWRSAKKGILRNIDIDLSSFTVIAGPALRSCCYQVGREFSGYKGIKSCIVEKDMKFYFDPISFARKELVKKGMKKDSFFDLNICSFCSALELPSYRKTKTSNRTLSFIALLSSRV